MIPPVELRPTYPIHTDRLVLRPLVAADAPSLAAYRSIPEVCRYVPFEPMDESVVRMRLGKEMGKSDLTDEGQAMTVGVERRDDKRLIGDVILMYRSESDATCEIGYVFDPGSAGKGYATEACAAVLDLAFGEMGLHRVFARMDARNDQSTRLAERLGMRREAERHEDEWFKGEWTSTYEYALLDREWSAKSDLGQPATT